MKRILDIIICVPLALLLFPLYLAISLLILLALGRPVFFVQERIGLRNRSFLLLKFRTMKVPNSTANENLSDEVRLTTLGSFLRKYSIDELPELLNIIRGEMSLVGPRPLLVEYLPLYSEFQARRHEVRPGLTGWAQVNGRNSLSWPEKFELDVWYVDNRSVWLDLKIIAITVVQVFRPKGIGHLDNPTAPKFRGNGS